MARAASTVGPAGGRARGGTLSPGLVQGAERLLRGAEKVGAVVVPVLIVAALTVFATTGWLSRHPLSGQGEHVMLLQVLREHAFIVLGLLVYTAVMYAVVLTLSAGVLRFVLARSDERLVSQGMTPRRLLALGRGSRAARGVTWLFARWWRVSLLLLVLWSPILVLQFPGYSSGDLVQQAREVLEDRASASPPPFDSYPIAHYLVPGGDTMLTTHHGAIPTLVYGTVLGFSADHLGGFGTGLVLLSLAQLAITLLALGRASSLLARWVTSPGLRILALVVIVVGGLPIAFWSMAIGPAPVFAAALCWVLALAIDHVRSRERILPERIIEWTLVSLLVAATGSYGAFVLLVLLVMTVLARHGWHAWRAALVSLALPALLVPSVIAIGVAGGRVIPEDPMQSRSLQIQSLALALHENPDSLSDRDAKTLDRVFDAGQLGEDYDPASIGPVLGAGDTDGAYRRQDVTAAQAQQFPGVWKNTLADQPTIIADGMLLQTFHYFDPLGHGRGNLPTTTQDDGASEVSVGGHGPLSDDALAPGGRGAAHTLASALDDSPVLRLLTEAPLRVVAVLGLAAIAVALRRPNAWIWVLPLALCVRAVMTAPEDSSGLHSLVFVYLLPFALLALAASRELVAQGTPDPGGSSMRRVRRSALTRSPDAEITTDDGADEVVAADAAALAAWSGPASPAYRSGGPQGRHQRSAAAERAGKYGPLRPVTKRPLAPNPGLHKKRGR